VDVLGTVCSPLQNSRSGPSPRGHDSIWVRHLVVTPASSASSSRARLRTECVPLSRVCAASLDNVGNQAVYLSALNSMMGRPPSVNCSTTSSTNNENTIPGEHASMGIEASLGLKPCMSRPPGRNWLIESKENSPPDTPPVSPLKQHRERGQSVEPVRTSQRRVDQDECIHRSQSAVTVPVYNSAGDNAIVLTTADTVVDRETTLDFEDVSVPKEARVLLTPQTQNARSAMGMAACTTNTAAMPKRGLRTKKEFGPRLVMSKSDFLGHVSL